MITVSLLIILSYIFLRECFSPNKFWTGQKFESKLSVINPKYFYGFLWIAWKAIYGFEKEW